MIALGEVQMEDYTREQLEYVLNYVKQVFRSRDLKETTLAGDSGIAQSTVSRLLTGKLEPTVDVLRKLCMGLGTNFEEVVQTPQRAAPYLLGYLATPLTGLTESEDHQLRKLVASLKNIAGPETFSDPRFELYWPGDFTHPKSNPDHTAEQVYRKDRAFASTYNFLVVLCLKPSYGVGQENEIATQAGNPAIRLLESTASRMMRGSLLHAVDVQFTGSLDSGLHFDQNELRAALEWVQRSYFLQFPLYQNLNGHEFGERLRRLMEKRITNHSEFAAKLGVAPQYLDVLKHESFVVSNPSARLLKRLSALLGISVGYLLGESREADPVWINSHSTWRHWIRTPGIEAGLAYELKEEWEAGYIRSMGQREPSYASHRNEISARQEKDWDIEYQKRMKRVAAEQDGQAKLW
jgi:transcriptional regulator with XRE-family HTH domain